ncbi:MAG TPA: hypothetical protein PKC67_06085 [Kiritimatiellia bacterium]|nr:hypothetical protein [Kiritimatiellia bacterium]HMP33904.1 hypothetical protein [Kiritimatiellia bacterium]
MVVYRTVRKKKKDNTPMIVGALVVVAAIGFILLQQGGGKKTAESTPETAPTNQPATVSTEAVIPKAPAIPEVFDDPREQDQFEAVYKTVQSVFAAPTPGSPLRVIKKRGGRAEGELLRFTATGLVLSTPDGLITIQRDEIDEASQATLFPDAFSSTIAENAVRAGHVKDAPPTLERVLLTPPSTQVQETRRFSSDRLTARYGPGRHFATIPGADLYRGQLVHVVAETNAWVCIKVGDMNAKVFGWIPKFASFTLKPESKAIIERETEALMDTGFVVAIDPSKNEVLVDMYEWRIADPAAIEGQCRLLAYYCGHQRGSRLYWVDLRDALTNRRIAEYSESKGFKVF